MSRTTSNRPVRARDLGLRFDGQPGPLNSITDVEGVTVGQVTLTVGDTIRTGVTAIVPPSLHTDASGCAAAVSSFNGNGEMTGRAWIDEAGMLTTPVMLTATHSVGAVHEGVHAWLRERRSDRSLPGWALPVVAETWDGYLNDEFANAVRPEHAVAALESATPTLPQEGSRGGGTGMNAYGFKAGTGTASRRISIGDEQYTLGVLLQANHGRRDELTIGGQRIGAASTAPCPIEEMEWITNPTLPGRAPAGAGSIIAIVATDAPLLPGQLAALARRVPLGLARNGTSGSHFSGDIFLAFSTANAGAFAHGFASTVGHPTSTMQFLQWGRLDSLLDAVVQSVEEAVINALVAAEDTVGRDGHRSYALPHEEIRALVTP